MQDRKDVEVLQGESSCKCGKALMKFAEQYLLNMNNTGARCPICHAG
jgi:hypothetical protein